MTDVTPRRRVTDGQVTQTELYAAVKNLELAITDLSRTIDQRFDDFVRWRVLVDGEKPGGAPARLRILEDDRTRVQGAIATGRAFQVLTSIGLGLIAIYTWTRGLG